MHDLQGAGRAPRRAGRAWAWVLIAGSLALSAHAADRQSLDDAWWTGPIIANSPAALPPGHLYVEPYVYDVQSSGVHAYGSQSFILYGVTRRFTMGFIPAFGYTRLRDGNSSSHVGVGDIALHAQYALTSLDVEHRVPAIAVAVEQSLPTGRFDRLSRPANGFGAGVYTTTVALYAQDVYWMPNGRILRARLNLSGSWSGNARLADRSVYGTNDGFRGEASPGAALAFDSSWEYSLSQHWGLALDLYYRHRAATRTIGADATGPVRLTAGAADTYALVPAVEYNWNARVGVIGGVRMIPASRNTTTSVTPVIALSLFI